MDEALRFHNPTEPGRLSELWICGHTVFIGRNRRERPARARIPTRLSPPRRKLSWRSCTASGLSTKLPPQCGRSYWMKGDTCARSEPCIAFCPNVWKSRSVAASAAIPNTPSQNSWPPAPTNDGHGTSPSSRVPSNGVITTSMWFWISSAATWWAGWWPPRRTHAWPRL